MAEPDYVAVNRESWTRANAQYTDRSARDSWAQREITWGHWSIPEREVRILPEVTGKDVIELGCGTAYFGAWLKRAGAARVVGVDVTPAQLETARRMDEEFGLGLELVEANAEDVPLPDGSFDLVFSEFGASIWCDPALWIAEAARLLRPAGELVFLRGSTLNVLCQPDEGLMSECLARPQKGLYRLEWDDEDGAGATGVSQYGHTCQSASSGALQFAHDCRNRVVQTGQIRNAGSTSARQTGQCISRRESRSSIALISSSRSRTSSRYSGGRKSM